MLRRGLGDYPCHRQYCTIPIEGFPEMATAFEMPTPEFIISSLDIAIALGQQHFRVMRDIRLKLNKLYLPNRVWIIEDMYLTHCGQRCEIFSLQESEFLKLVQLYRRKQRFALVRMFLRLKALDGKSLLTQAEAQKMVEDRLSRDHIAAMAIGESKIAPEYSLHDSQFIGQPINRYSRRLLGVSPSKTLDDLVKAGFLRKSRGNYCVGARYRYDTFIEMVSPHTGEVRIVLGQKGGEVLRYLHAMGSLSLQKRFQSV
jgi:hypothetical protein